MSFGNCCGQGCVTTSRGFYYGERNGLAEFASLIVAKYKVKCPATITGITTANKTSYTWTDDFTAHDYLAGDIVMVRVVTPRVCETTEPTYQEVVTFNADLLHRYRKTPQWVYPDAKNFSTADWNGVELVTCRFFKASVDTSNKPLVKYGVGAYSGETIHPNWTEVTFPFTAATVLPPSLTTVDKVTGFGVPFTSALKPTVSGQQTPIITGMVAEVTFITDSVGTPRTGHFVANTPTLSGNPLQTPVTQIKPGMRCVSGANTFYALIAMTLVTTPGGISSATPVGGYQLNPDSCIGMNYTSATKPAWRLVSIAGTYAFCFKKPPYESASRLALTTRPVIQLDTHDLTTTVLTSGKSNGFDDDGVYHSEWFSYSEAKYPSRSGGSGNASNEKPDFTAEPTTEWVFNLNATGDARFTGTGQALYPWLQTFGSGPFATAANPRAMYNFWEALGGTGVVRTSTFSAAFADVLHDIEISSGELKFTRQVSAVLFNALGRHAHPTNYRDDYIYEGDSATGPWTILQPIQVADSMPLVNFGDIPLRAYIALVEIRATATDAMSLAEFAAALTLQPGNYGVLHYEQERLQGQFIYGLNLKKVTVPNITVCAHPNEGGLSGYDPSTCYSFSGPGEIMIPEDAWGVTCTHRVVVGYNPSLPGPDKNVYMDFPGCECV